MLRIEKGDAVLNASSCLQNKFKPSINQREYFARETAQGRECFLPKMHNFSTIVHILCIKLESGQPCRCSKCFFHVRDFFFLDKISVTLGHYFESLGI